MDAPSQTSPGERCAEHNLAVGPTGECVLCRRVDPGRVAQARWLSPVLVAAGLGTALLCGVALGRRHTPPAPVAEAAPAEPAETARPVEEPIEESPVALLAETRPREVLPAPVAAATHAPPQRNYLEEAYAAMPKGNLYGDAPARAATAQPTASAPPALRPRFGMGGRGRGGGRR
jgi:hypothetical protein